MGIGDKVQEIRLNTITLNLVTTASPVMLRNREDECFVRFNPTSPVRLSDSELQWYRNTYPDTDFIVTTQEYDTILFAKKENKDL